MFTKERRRSKKQARGQGVGVRTAVAPAALGGEEVVMVHRLPNERRTHGDD